MQPFGLQVLRVDPTVAVIGWVPVPEAQWYEVVLLPYHLVARVREPSVTLTGLVPRSRYAVQVMACNAFEGCSAPSPPLTVETP